MSYDNNEQKQEILRKKICVFLIQKEKEATADDKTLNLEAGLFLHNLLNGFTDTVWFTKFEFWEIETAKEFVEKLSQKQYSVSNLEIDDKKDFLRIVEPLFNEFKKIQHTFDTEYDKAENPTKPALANGRPLPRHNPQTQKPAVQVTWDGHINLEATLEKLKAKSFDTPDWDVEAKYATKTDDTKELTSFQIKQDDKRSITADNTSLVFASLDDQEQKNVYEAFAEANPDIKSLNLATNSIQMMCNAFQVARDKGITFTISKRDHGVYSKQECKEDIEKVMSEGPKADGYFHLPGGSQIQSKVLEDFLTNLNHDNLLFSADIPSSPRFTSSAG